MKKTLLCTAILTLLAIISVRADLIWYEGFQYTNGSLTTNALGVWARESGTASAPGDMYVNHSNLEVSATGGSVSRQDDCDRLFAVTPNSSFTNHVQLVYASFTVICTNLPNGPGSYFASFYNTARGYCGRVQAFTNGTVLPKTWRLGVTDNSFAVNNANGGFPVDLALNTPYQVVEELDPITLQAATIWVNPTDLSQTGNAPTESHYSANDSIGFQTTNQVNSYAFRQASSFGNSFFVITNLAVATTFAEAATNVWSTNATAPTIVYQPVGLTNYVGNPISLSAVANGQGLGSLTYLWLRSGSPYPSGNGANILNISSAQTNDDGDYTIVATAPNGLSTTSSVAHVFINPAPDSPTFITQPVSKTIYNGQSVTFSTAVISPDINTIYYQWKSNNVDIAGANASTLTLNIATTNYSGSAYSVGVTNDVNPVGILSTNAVLTVLSPPAVSIGYLRTLVDPTTYAPTNVPPTLPYQVTGVVTTFTNITSGNTASYYLQDGTGGINIFATLASTFRPAQGDVVTFVGVLSSFTTGFELYADPSGAFPYTSYTDTGATNALPAAINIPFTVTNNNLAYVNYNLAESLVTIKDVYLGTNAGTVLSTTANQTITVTNSSGQKFALSFFSLDQDTAGMTLPAHAASVTGVLYGGNPNFSVGVTRFADIVASPPAAIPVDVTKSGKNIVLSWGNPLFDLQFSTNVAGPYSTLQYVTSPYTNSTTTNASGFFRLKF